MIIYIYICIYIYIHIHIHIRIYIYVRILLTPYLYYVHMSHFLLRTGCSCSWVQNPTVSYLLRRMKLSLGTLQHHDRFWLNHGVGGKDQIIKQVGEEQKQKEQKGCVDIFYFWGRAGNMPAFDDETFVDEAFGDENFRWRVFRWWASSWQPVPFLALKMAEFIFPTLYLVWFVASIKPFPPPYGCGAARHIS